MRAGLPFVCVLCVSRSRAGTGCWMNTHVLKLCSALGSNLRAASRQQRGRLYKPRGLAALLVGSQEWRRAKTELGKDGRSHGPASLLSARAWRSPKLSCKEAAPCAAASELFGRALSSERFSL